MPDLPNESLFDYDDLTASSDAIRKEILRGRPIPEATDAIKAVAEKALEMLNQFQSGKLWQTLIKQ